MLHREVRVRMIERTTPRTCAYLENRAVYKLKKLAAACVILHCKLIHLFAVDLSTRKHEDLFWMCFAVLSTCAHATEHPLYRCLRIGVKWNR